MEYAIVRLPTKADQKARYYAYVYGEAQWSSDVRNAIGFSWSDAIKRRDSIRALSGLTMEGRQAINVINLVS